MARSQWFVSMMFNGETLATSPTSGTQVTVNRALPRSNFLSCIGGTLRSVGVALLDLTFDNITVLLSNSQQIYNTRGGVARGVNRYENGSTKNGTATSTTNLAMPFQVQFGRFLRDTVCCIPAKIYRSVDLTLSFTPTATTSITSVQLDLWAEEFISDDDPLSKRIRRVLRIDTRTPAASSVNQIDTVNGGLLAGIFLRLDDLDNIGANGPATGGTNGINTPVQVIGNGTDIPVSIRPDCIDAILVNRYRQDDAAVPTGLVADSAVATGTAVLYKVAEFDLDDSLERAIDTNRLNRLQVVYTTAGSGQSGTVEVIQLDYIPVVLV